MSDDGDCIVTGLLLSDDAAGDATRGPEVVSGGVVEIAGGSFFEGRGANGNVRGACADERGDAGVGVVFPFEGWAEGKAGGCRWGMSKLLERRAALIGRDRSVSSVARSS